MQPRGNLRCGSMTGTVRQGRRMTSTPGPVVQRPRTPAFQAGNAGSNPVGATTGVSWGISLIETGEFQRSSTPTPFSQPPLRRSNIGSGAPVSKRWSESVSAGVPAKRRPPPRKPTRALRHLARRYRTLDTETAEPEGEIRRLCAHSQPGAPRRIRSGPPQRSSTPSHRR